MTTTPHLPLRVGSSDERTALRSLFDRAGFRDGPICERLGLASLDNDHRIATAARKQPPADALGVLARLFLCEEPLPASDVAPHLASAEVEALEATDLIQAGSRQPDATWRATVRLVPVKSGDREWWIAADPLYGTQLSGLPADTVFTGHNPLTRQFLRLMPPSIGGNVLDLCSGTGVDAIACNPAGSSVMAVDVTVRATHFAAFNAWLNDAPHVQAVQGDLYAPAEGREFDWVIAHPPYVPTLREIAIYRDGGEMGDAILRRIIEGLPGHLKVGGSFFILSMALDTSEGRYEERVRSWLGAAGREFDLVFGIVESKPIDEFARVLVDRAQASEPGDLDRWMDLFSTRGVKETVYGALVGHRIGPAAGECETRRVGLPEDVGPDSFEWMMHWFEWRRRPGLRERVLASRPRLAPRVKLHVVYGVGDNGLRPEGYRLTNPDAPFVADMKTDAWVLSLLSGFDGVRTPLDVLAAADPGMLPDQLDPEQLVDLVCAFAERRMLTLDGLEPQGR